MVVRRLAVRQARIRFSALHPREVFPTELTSDEERGEESKRMNVLYECDELNVCTRKYQKHKEWHHATKTLINGHLQSYLW